MLLLLLACSSPPAPVPAPPPAAAVCGLLTINDTYQVEGLPDQSGGIARVRTIRQELEKKQGPIVLLHAGDLLGPSLPSRAFGGEQMVDALNQLDGDGKAQDPRMFVVFGNHEFDNSKLADAAKLQARLEQSQFQWLDTSLQWAKGPDGAPLVQSAHQSQNAITDCNGIKLGIFGITTDGKKAEYVSAFQPPMELARAQTAELRSKGAEVVIGLTHQNMADDLAILSTLGDAGPDLIVGGHEHVAQTEAVDRRAVFKADADARTAWHITLVRDEKGIERKVELLKLDQHVAPDPAVTTVVNSWLTKDDALVCSTQKQENGCLDQPFPRTVSTTLIGEELQIRRFETNLGNWLADLARDSFPKAQIAMLNAGSLRLNRNIPPGKMTRKDVETLFAYPAELNLIQINGEILQKVVNRAIEKWTGNGNWLQISGFAWAHDPKQQVASRLTLLDRKGPRSLKSSEKILAVVPHYLVDPAGDQDGYTMLNEKMIVSTDEPDLKAIVYEQLMDGNLPPIAAEREGRICNLDEMLKAGRKPPCLALP